MRLCSDHAACACIVINKHDSRAAFACFMHDGNGCHIFSLVIQPKSVFFSITSKKGKIIEAVTRELGERDKTKLMEIKRDEMENDSQRDFDTQKGNFASKVPIVLNCNTRLCKSLPYSE